MSSSSLRNNNNKPLCHRYNIISILSSRISSFTFKISSIFLLMMVFVLYNNNNNIMITNNKDVKKNNENVVDSNIIKELQDLVMELRGDDYRLMRWNALKHTKKIRKEGKCEDGLPKALKVIASSSSSSSSQEEVAKGFACEVLTFCITDNPKQRSRLQEEDYDAIVNIISTSETYHTIAMACHVIYIASFSNESNQQGFYKAGAVPQLSKIIKKNISDYGHLNLAIMWSAAALQNLAANYCNTKKDGRCYWVWERRNDDMILKIPTEEMDIISDGSSIRREIFNDKDLIRTLKTMVCSPGPVQGDMSEGNPYIGQNARINNYEHTNSEYIVSWAAAGVLKNLALESKEARSFIEQNDNDNDTTTTTLHCLCRLAYSPDWLEVNKGQGALHHLRPSDPCRLLPNDDEKTNNDGNNKKQLFCVDDVFMDQENYTCIDYVKDTKKKECETKSIIDSEITAKKACCGCGGGKSEMKKLF